jgi:hypothetical protein
VVRHLPLHRLPTFSGSAFRGGVAALRETVTVTGNPKIYVKVADSGRRRIQAFCPVCGTALYADHPEAQTPYVSLRTGFLDQRRQLVPGLQTWRRSALEWPDRLAEIPCLDEDVLDDSMFVGVRSE